MYGVPLLLISSKLDSLTKDNQKVAARGYRNLPVFKKRLFIQEICDRLHTVCENDAEADSEIELLALPHPEERVMRDTVDAEYNK